MHQVESSDWAASGWVKNFLGRGLARSDLEQEIERELDGLSEAEVDEMLRENAPS